MEKLTVALVCRHGLIPDTVGDVRVRLVREPHDIRSRDDVVLFRGERMAQELIRFRLERPAQLPPAVFLAPWLDWSDVSSAFDHGAVSYLLENRYGFLLAEAIQCAPHGASILDPLIAAEQVRMATPLRNPSAAPEYLARLAPREQQTMELLSSGFTVREVARHMSLSEKTVRNYVSSIFAKLGVEGRPAAIVLAREAGLGAPPR